jgi:hypothetical protein
MDKISATTLKAIVGAVLFGSWSYLVYSGKVPATDYVENIKILLGGLGLYHVVSKASDPSTSVTVPIDPAPQPVAPVTLPTTVVQQ